MRVTGWSRSILVLALLLVATSMFAQATRTWVSGVGDDVNPCSRTAPCKTFAGAISKTASGGIIDALDPGGYGTLTITKPITVEGNGTLASTLNSAVNGFVVNIAAGPTNRHVVLRNILIDGAGTTLGVDGVRFLSGDSLTLENVDIKTQSGDGIDFQPNSTARLVVNNCRIQQAGTNGILIKPTATGAGRVSIHNSTISRNGTGIRIEDLATVSIVNSHVTNNTSDGILTITTGATGSVVLVEDSEISQNAGTGVRTSGANSVMRVANSLINGNGTGAAQTSGTLCSYGNNRLAGNLAGNDGAFGSNCVPGNL